MSLNSNSIEPSLKVSNLLHRIRVFFAVHPEWWVWFFCGGVWILLIWNSLFTVILGENVSNLITCLPIDSINGEDLSSGILKQPSVFESIQGRFMNSMFPWVVMVIAMMFPLLQSAIKHTAFSVRRTDREMSILLFLFGYALVWSTIGLLFLILPVGLDLLFGSASVFSQGVAAGIVFIIAAVMSWLPSRQVIMVRCEFTRPIRISGWKRVKDCVLYGIIIGVACLRMCWVVMAALMLAHHSTMLMLLVTMIVLIERYRIPHESRIPGYAWTVIGFALIISGTLVGINAAT